MTAPTPGTSYLSRPEAISLHATFVRNVEARMRELGWVHVEGHNRGKLQLTRLAEAANIPLRTVENLMRLQNQPTMVGAAAIASALNTRLDTLLGQEGDFGPSVSSAGTGHLTCIHTSAWPTGMYVCHACHAKWLSYQTRLNALYSATRVAATTDADIRNEERKARVAADGQDPDDVKR